MKRRISVLLLAGMLLLLTACGGVVRPPVRIGEATGNASFRSYSLTEAFEEADVVALVQVGNWLGENTDGFPYTYYEADALECYKGDIPAHFTLMQSGASTSTYEDYPLYTYGNQLLLFLDQTQTDWGESYIQYPGAYVNVCSFITMMYVANADDGSRYFVDRFGLMTYEELMNNPGSATLGQPAAQLRDRGLMAELSDNVKGTDKLLAESLAAAGDMQSNPHAGITAYVYSEDTLKALFASLSGE